MTRIKGLEALFSASKNDLKSKEDCIVAALHCILINADLLCVGLGEVFSESDSNSVTELLPENWNENQDVYCLRYRSCDMKKCYLLKIAKAGNSLHVNLVLNEEKYAGMTINIDDYVSNDYNKFTEAFKNLDQLNEGFQQKILNEIKVGGKNSGKSPSKEFSKKKTSKVPDPIPSVVPIPQIQPIPTGVPDNRRYGGSPLSVIPQIGGNDLDPLGRSQGGMHFDPSSFGVPSRSSYGRGGLGRFGRDPMGLPPHAVPPGARFDPFSPIAPNRFNPDPDNFRPPDYDNMFM